MGRAKWKWISIVGLIVIAALALLIRQGSKKNVIFVCDGFVSDETLLEAFETYQKKYEPFEVQPNPTYISFDMDFPVKSCRVTRLSHVDESNGEEELQSYIDRPVGKLIEGSMIKLDTSWWYDSGEWTQQYKLWSYLMLIEDMDGQDHYYYCRLNFCK